MGYANSKIVPRAGRSPCRPVVSPHRRAVFLLDHFQNCHQLFLAGAGSGICACERLSDDPSTRRERTICMPPHAPQNAVNICICAFSPAGRFGNTTRIKSEGASKSSLSPHRLHGVMLQSGRSSGSYRSGIASRSKTSRGSVNTAASGRLGSEAFRSYFHHGTVYPVS